MTGRAELNPGSEFSQQLSVSKLENVQATWRGGAECGAVLLL